MKVPTIVDGDVSSWESHTILRYLAALHAPKLTGANPAECTQVERWMDWLLGALNAPYVAVFKDAKKPAAERAGDFAAQSADRRADQDPRGLYCRSPGLRPTGSRSLTSHSGRS